MRLSIPQPASASETVTASRLKRQSLPANPRDDSDRKCL